jgi:hypothetical protein
MKITKEQKEAYKKATLNLCESCVHHPSECGANPKFGTGFGNDNVYECDGHEYETKPIADTMGSFIVKLRGLP